MTIHRLYRFAQPIANAVFDALCEKYLQLDHRHDRRLTTANSIVDMEDEVIRGATVSHLGRNNLAATESRRRQPSSKTSSSAVANA